MASVTKKVVQTTLSMSEYRAFVETISKKKLSIQEGLHRAAVKMIEDENRLDKGDSFFKLKIPKKGSDLGDLSANHDRYLYGAPKRNKISE